MRVRPGERHWGIFHDLVSQHGLRGNDIPDAYLAALALEQGATWVTTDRGFARYEGLRLLDPLRP
jgi:predicted nucleic acid-binding protein